jgi:hypothetical protein
MRNVVERAGESVVNLGRQTEFTYERKRHTFWSNTAFDPSFFVGFSSLFAELLRTFTLQRHNTAENSKQIFPGKELCGYSPNSYIHISVSDLYIPQICSAGK